MGIDIRQHNNQAHKVLLALIDVDEGVWINKASQVWVGRLTVRQKRQLNQSIAVTPGTFYPDQTAEIASALIAQLDCQAAPPTPIFLKAQNDAIRQHLEQYPGFILTDDESSAESVIKLSQDQAQIKLELEVGFAPVRLAQVRLKSRPDPRALLSAVSLKQRQRECRGHGKHCVDVGYELYQDAYVFQFYTKAGAMVPLTCDLPKRQKAGRVNFGLKVKPTHDHTRPSLGYYVLATDNFDVAAELAALMGRGSNRCGSRIESADIHRSGIERHGTESSSTESFAIKGTEQNWISSLGRVIEQRKVAWRALHLTNSAGHIRTL